MLEQHMKALAGAGKRKTRKRASAQATLRAKSGAETPVPSAPTPEDAHLPGEYDILAVAEEVLRY